MSEELDYIKIFNYLLNEYEVMRIKSIKLNKKTINIKFESLSGNEWSITEDKEQFIKRSK